MFKVVNGMGHTSIHGACQVHAYDNAQRNRARVPEGPRYGSSNKPGIHHHGGLDSHPDLCYLNTKMLYSTLRVQVLCHKVSTQYHYYDS